MFGWKLSGWSGTSRALRCRGCGLARIFAPDGSEQPLSGSGPDLDELHSLWAAEAFPYAKPQPSKATCPSRTRSGSIRDISPMIIGRGHRA